MINETLTKKIQALAFQRSVGNPSFNTNEYEAAMRDGAELALQHMESISVTEQKIKRDLIGVYCKGCNQIIYSCTMDDYGNHGANIRVNDLFDRGHKSGMITSEYAKEHAGCKCPNPPAQ